MNIILIHLIFTHVVTFLKKKHTKKFLRFSVCLLKMGKNSKMKTILKPVTDVRHGKS